jgi:hypothetical protein
VIIILRTISITLTGDRRNEGQLAAALIQTVEDENG